MKRVLSAILACLFCLSLSACSLFSAEEQTDVMPKFTTQNMAGEEVTDEIFSRADLTVVNFWGTYCAPCIGEMPDLAAWSEAMPDNVQLIGIMVDVDAAGTKEYELAEEIIAKTGVTYENLMVTEEMNELIGEMAGVPTTFFIDREGRFAANPILGADVEKYKESVEGYLHEEE